MKFFASATARLLAAGISVLTIASVAIAQTRTWTGGGAPDPNWSNAANWGGAAPNPLDALAFATATLTTSNNNTAAATQYNGITFGASAPSYTLAGNAITLGGDVANNSTNPQTITLPLILNADRVINVVDMGSLSINAISSPDGAFGVMKTGTGQLILGASNTYTGETVLDGGALAYSGNSNVGAIAFGSNPTADIVSTTSSTLALTSANVTASSLSARNDTTDSPELMVSPNLINIGAARTLTVNGPFTVGIPGARANVVAGGTTELTVAGDPNAVNDGLVVNGGAGFLRVGLEKTNAAPNPDPVSFLDLSGLSNFSYTATTGELRVGAGNSRGEMNLAGTNSITAAWVRVGDSGQDGGGTGGSANNNGGRSILRLGPGINLFNTDNFIVGRTKSGGTVEFQGATGLIVIAGQAGGASKSNIQIGNSNNATGSGDVSMLLLAGHNATIQGGNVIIGQLAGGGGGNSARGEVTFDTGTFSADSFRLGVNSSGAGANGATGTFTLGGPDPGSAATGVLNVSNEFFLAQRTNTNDAAGPSTGNFIINGGTANINTDIRDASTTISTVGPNVTTLTLAGGTLNMMGNDIGSAAASITNINLLGGSLSNGAIIAGKVITLGAGVNIGGAPTYVIDNSQMTGALDASALGTLTLASGGGLQGAGNVSGNVAAATGSRIAPGTDTAAGTLAFAGNLTLNNNSTVRFKLSDNAAAGNDQATVAGTLNVSAGTVNLELDALGTGPQSGNTYTLFNAPALTGNQTNFAIAGPLAQSRLSFTVVPTATTPGVVNLSVGGAGPMSLRWVGNVNSQWDLVGDSNWQSTGPQQFFNLDNVTFDDSSTNTNDVELVGQLQPASITVNAMRNYRLAGTGAITGGTGLSKSGTGTLSVATNNNYRGATAVNAGTLILSGNNTNTGAITVAAGATLQAGAGGPSGGLGSGAITNDGILIFNRSDASSAPNVISGGGELRHTGTGTLTLGAANTYTGATTITAGTLRVTDETSLGDLTGGAVAISSGGALDLSGSATANGIDFGGKQFLITGTGVGGTGALTNSGTVAQQNAFEQVVLTGDAAVGGTGRFDIRADTSTLDLAGFTLTKVGNGQFTLVGTTVSHGNIVVNGGIFAIETTSSLSSTGSTGTITYNPGSTAQFFNLTGDVSRPMVFNGGNTIGNASAQDSTVASPITLAGDVTFTNLNNSTGALTLTGNITEAGAPHSIIKFGPTQLTFAGTTNYTGTTTITSGTLNIPTGATLTTHNTVSTDPGTTFIMNGTATVGPIGGAGITTVGDGAAVAALTASSLRQGTLNIAAGSTTMFRPNGTTAGTSNFARLSIAGANDAWTSKLDVTNNDAVFQSSAANKTADFARLYNQVKQGFNSGTWNGLGITSSTAAANANADTGLAVVDNALLGYTEFSGQPFIADSILLKYTYYGDIDLNGQVDADDLTVFASNFGRTQGATQVDGDIDFNGAVNADDLTVFANNFNKGVGTPLAVGGVQAVPEPQAMLLAIAGVLVALAYCRNQRRTR